MNLDTIRQERQKWLKWKNIIPMRKALEDIENIKLPLNVEIVLDDCLKIGNQDILSANELTIIKESAKKLIPWRKGPFDFFGMKLDSEWQSNLKYNLLRPYFNLKNKCVADVGCNNGYYMFRMLEDNPKRIPGAVIRYCYIVENGADGAEATGAHVTDILNPTVLDLSASTVITYNGTGTCACDTAAGEIGGINGPNGTNPDAQGEVKVDFDAVAGGTTECAYVSAIIK